MCLQTKKKKNYSQKIYFIFNQQCVWVIYVLFFKFEFITKKIHMAIKIINKDIYSVL